MQKGDIAKLKLLLAGISARMTKNRDYFIRAVCTFTSGKKKFDAELSLDGQNWALRFQGSTSPTDAAAFCAFFASEAEKFDESVLVYTERSAVVTLSATARGVQMKQAEREASDEEKANAANPLLDSGRAAARDRHPDRRRQAEERYDSQIQSDRPLRRTGCTDV